MIETVRRLFGRPVLEQDSDEVLGKVSDLIFDAESDVAVALLMTTNSIIPFTRAILMKDILRVGKAGVVIGSADAVKMIDLEHLPGNAVTYFGHFHGQKVTDGRRRRKEKIRDAVFDFEASELTDFVLSGSRLQALLGKSRKMAARNFSESNGEITIQTEGGSRDE